MKLMGREALKDMRNPGARMLWKAKLAIVAAAFLAMNAVPVAARDLLVSTHLIDLRPEIALSDRVKGASLDGYALSGGEFLDFQRWYGRKWIDFRVDLMTQLSDEIGILWGVSTGEWSEKYRIDPGFRIGFVYMVKPSPQSVLALTFSTTLGGRLREKPCTADYGEIGGVQQVNCRLAASILAPEKTLAFLWNKRPPDHTRIGIRYQLSF